MLVSKELKRNNRIVSQEGQELFEFPSMFIFSLKATIRRKILTEEKGQSLNDDLFNRCFILKN